MISRDKTKKDILKCIEDGGWGHLTTKAITRELKIDMRVISQCLCILHKDGLVNRSKQGTSVIWELIPDKEKYI